ncbi:nodulation protein [Parasphingopyxis sp. CP4]|uniref:carbamoyltransferase family protein n=1 Tax=Parasphingopyxis sp. CP4 TaxID=2724527 RepID=UPI0015A148A5|nr:carbamoyltransferase N-terminal domain-containing protein [Parasphingopyxis sp. CP4]QLC22509.1 nodulation protein [Parasphingopyxis sp. CP4]
MSERPLVLGISALFHDAAAALVCGDDIVAAVQEERFSRRKNDWRFPNKAIAHCLAEWPKPVTLDAVAYYENPQLKMQRIVNNTIDNAPRGALVWPQALRTLETLNEALPARLQRILKDPEKIHFLTHHRAHAASAFLPSPFSEAAILVADGVGEWSTTSIWLGKEGKITPVRELKFPHSLGMLYSAFTQYCGFKVNSGEYKLMGLAPFGNPIFADRIRDQLIEIRADGSFALALEYFAFHNGITAINPLFENLFGQPMRHPDEPVTQHFRDIAASIQSVINDIMTTLAQTALALTRMRQLCLAGGVALNCVANAKILSHVANLDALWIQPASGDAGGALGGALDVARMLDDQTSGVRTVVAQDRMKNAFLGPCYDDQEIVDALDRKELIYQKYPDEDGLFRTVAAALAEGFIIGHFDGRMEFGPRALGNRSILADPRPGGTLSKINQRIKFREGWRPFAPMVLADCASQYFEQSNDSPYMLLTAKLRDPFISGPDLAQTLASGERDLPALQEAVSTDFTAVTHVDHSARLQTVSENSGTRAFGILKAFHELTECPMLLNTSFNVRGEPIVCSPDDAVSCFLDTEIDMLIIGSYLVRRSDQHTQLTSQLRRRRFHAD